MKRITFRGNWSLELLLFVVWLLFCLLVLVPWLVRHPHEHGRPLGDTAPVKAVR